MKTIIIYFLISILNFGLLFSKGKIIEIKDKVTKEPLHGVTVHFKLLEGKKKDSVVVRYSDKAGKLEYPFTGKSFAYLSFVGYHKMTDTIDENSTEIFMTSSSIKMKEVVVTGSFKPVSIQESIYDVKVINQEKIATSGGGTLRELLMTEANMQLSQDGILGTSISINGISGENIKIMIDGVPVIGRMNGNIDLSQINLNNVERVEVIEGPMSVLYGSDALGGVINLITKDPNCERLEYDGTFYYESVGQYNLDASVRTSVKDVSFQLNAGRNLFQGFDAYNKSRNIQWNPKEQYFANLQTAFIKENHNLKFHVNFFDEMILNRGGLIQPYFEHAYDDKYKTRRLTNNIIYNGKFADDYYLSLTSSYSYYNRKKNEYYKDMVTLNEYVTTPANQDTSDFYTYMLRGVFSDDKLTSFLKYQTGLDLTYDIATGKKIDMGEQTIYDLATFASLQIDPFDGLTIQPSLRVIYNSKYEAPLIPVLNIKYKIIDNLVFRASYGRGFRSPSIKELYYEFVDINHNIHGNKDLKAEQSDGYNASLNYYLNLDDFYVSIEPKFYYNDIRNLITLANIDNTGKADDKYMNINIGNYETIGGNLSFQFFKSDLSFTNTVSYSGALNSLWGRTDPNDIGRDIPKFNFYWEYSSNVDYNIDILNLKFNTYYKYTGKKPQFAVSDHGVEEIFLEDYHWLDMSLTYQIFKMFDLTFGVKNIFNTLNVSVSDMKEQSPNEVDINRGQPIGWGRALFLNFKFKVN